MSNNNTENIEESENEVNDEIGEEEEENHSTTSSSTKRGSKSPSLKRRLRNSQERTIINNRLEDFGGGSSSSTTPSKSISTNNKSSPKATTSRTTRKESTTIIKRVEVETQEEYDRDALDGERRGQEREEQEELVVVQRREWISENNIICRFFRQLLDSWHYIAFGLAFIVVFTIFAKANWEDVPSNGVKKQSTVSPGITSWLDGQTQFKESIKILQKKYPSQPSNTWIQIYSAITSTMTEEKPKQPSSIVLLTHPSVNTEFASCLSREIAVNTHSVFYNITGQQYTRKIREINQDYLNSKGTITEIHDDLKTYLNNGKVVIIQDIEKVNKPEHLYIFHAFCDNSAAPDKRATFIFIVPVPQSILDEFEWKEENSATISQEIFTSAWTSLSPDKRPALIARVAATVLLIQPGDTCHKSSGNENNNNNNIPREL